MHWLVFVLFCLFVFVFIFSISSMFFSSACDRSILESFTWGPLTGDFRPFGEKYHVLIDN
jgi:hypothetical protein